MSERIPFTYGEFYDVPPMIRFQFDGGWYFLRSEFDEEADEYTDFYDVYRLPFHSDEEIGGHAEVLDELGRRGSLGTHPNRGHRA